MDTWPSVVRLPDFGTFQNVRTGSRLTCREAHVSGSSNVSLRCYDHVISRALAVLTMVSACGSGTPVASGHPAHSAASGNFEQLVDGKLWFRSCAGSLPAILLEAGGGADSSSWKNLPQQIADASGHRVVAYDRAGFGNSPFPAEPFTVAEEIAQLHRSLRILGIDKGVVVAESYG